VGYYADDDLTDVGITTALMTREMAFAREANELPSFGRHFGYHFENEKLCAYLEWEATRRGVEVREGTVVEVRQDERGITGLLLDGGELVTADLYLDSSGFRSELLGRALGEPFVDFKRSLFCDRAVVGGWDRVPGEALHPYTTAETMDHGWCWRIDHEHRINRGYVYSSAFAPDDQAEREFREKNPRVATTRIVKFPTGRYQRAWVKNVVSVGNASGFVEPLESTSLAAICVAAQNLAEMLVDCDRQARPTTRSLYNRRTAQGWDNIRRFLAVHYKYNTRLETQFWRACRADVDLAGAEPIVEFYQENGPTPIWNQTLLEPTDQFGAEGYMAMFIGQHLPYQKTYQPGAPELETWGRIRRGIGGKADAGVSTVEALAHIRAPSWVWSPQFFQ
jgi:tryptophan halogenase